MARNFSIPEIEIENNIESLSKLFIEIFFKVYNFY